MLKFLEKIYQKIVRVFRDKEPIIVKKITDDTTPPKGRKVNLIIIHCSASDNPRHDNIAVIKEWHVKGNGWRDVGYHWFIRKSGVVEKGRDEREVGAHCSGYNKNSIGICFSGNVEFTPEQFKSAADLIKIILKKYNLTTKNIAAHNEFTKYKTCPNFDIRKIVKLIDG